MLMKKLSILICFSFFLQDGYSQDKKDLVLSFNAGVFNSPYYKKSSEGEFYKAGGEHFLSKNHSLSFDFLGARHFYYDDDIDKNSAVPVTGSGNTNSQALYTIFSISYKYKVINKNKFSVVPGVGAGIMTHSRKYPASIPNDGGIRVLTSTLSDLVFPVSLDIQYEVVRNFQIGITSGFFVHPDYPVLGWHVGPGFSYILK